MFKLAAYNKKEENTSVKCLNKPVLDSDQNCFTYSLTTLMLFVSRTFFKRLHVVTFRFFPAARPYNAPVLAVATLNMMAAQSVSIDKYQEGDQQVNSMYSSVNLMFYCLVISICTIYFGVTVLFF